MPRFAGPLMALLAFLGFIGGIIAGYIWLAGTIAAALGGTAVAWIAAAVLAAIAGAFLAEIAMFVLFWAIVIIVVIIGFIVTACSGD